MELKRSDLSILPPASLLIEVEAKGEDRRQPVWTASSIFSVKQSSTKKLTFHAPVRPLHTDLLNKRPFHRSRGREKTDQKQMTPSRHPPICRPCFIRFLHTPSAPIPAGCGQMEIERVYLAHDEKGMRGNDFKPSSVSLPCWQRG